MSTSPDASVRQVARDLAKLRAQGTDSSGFNAIKNEIAKGFACLSDPQWRKVLSPPFDFCASKLVDTDGPPFLVNIAEQQEFAQTSAPIIRATYTSFLIYKRRASVTSTREQCWLLDEIGNVGKWPLAVELATFGAGYGIRPIYVVQTTDQFDNLAPRAGEIIPQACETQVFLSTRTVSQASLISPQLGKMTLEFDNREKQLAARDAGSKAIADMVLSGSDPLKSVMSIAHQHRMARQKSKMARDLRTVDEIINEKNDRAYVFMPGVLERPFYSNVRRYWRRRDLAGKYLGDRFHSKPSFVEIATPWGQRNRRIITEDTPRHMRDWPQYAGTGKWSFVKGFRP